MLETRVVCPKHPAYRAIMRPRVKCADCWTLYFRRLYKDDTLWADEYGGWARPSHA